MTKDRLTKVLERADDELEFDHPDARRHLTWATLAVAVAMVEVADEIRELRRSIENADQHPEVRRQSSP